MTFNSHKCPNTKSDVIQHRALAAALSAFNQTLLFQRPMIHLDPPCRFGLDFPFGFSHRSQARRPVFRCAVCGANTKYFDLSKTFEPADCSVAARQSGIGHRLQTTAVDSDLPVRFQARQKMPAQSPNQFQVFDRRIPTVETNKLRVKAALVRLKQHFGEMIVFRFPVAVFIKYAIIYRNDPNAVSPQQSNQVDSIDDGLLLARPMPINKGVKLRIRFLKRRIIQNKDAGVNINLVLASCQSVSASGSRRASKRVKDIVRGSVSALRLNSSGFGGSHVTRRGDDKVNVIFLSNFWRIHSLFLSNNYSTS